MPPLDTSRDHGVAFLDLETTGSYPWAGAEPWEVALITQDPPELVNEGHGNQRTEYPWVEFVWHLPVDLGKADPIALRIGRFHERYGEGVTISNPVDFASDFASVTNGKHLVGAVPSFDAERFLEGFLRGLGACPSWHYHLIDVEALAVGYLRGRASNVPPENAGFHRMMASVCVSLPWNSADLSRAVGVDPDESDKHTALGDARWAKAIYEQVMT